MRLHPTLVVALTSALALTACSGTDADVGQAGSTTTAVVTTTTTAPALDDQGVLYVHHAVLARVDRRGSGFLLTLDGAERRSQWFTHDRSGLMPTRQLAEDWSDLDLADPPPQAAVVPASYDQEPVLLELANPSWDEAARVLTFDADTVTEADPRLAGLVEDPATDPLGTYASVTVYLHQPDTEVVPGPPTPTTTTSTTTTSSTTTTTTTVPASGPSTTDGPGRAVTGPTTAPPPTGGPPPTPGPTVAPPPPTAPPRPGGEPDITADVVELRLESIGGSFTTFTLRNAGTAVGSWSTAVPRETGLAMAPSSGILVPGKSTEVRLTYDGSGPNNDFATDIVLTTAAGRTLIRVEVYPPP